MMPNNRSFSAVIFVLLLLMTSSLYAQGNGGVYDNQILDQARNIYEPMRRDASDLHDEYNQYRRRKYQSVPRQYQVPRKQYRPLRQGYIPENYRRQYRRSYNRFNQFKRSYHNRYWYPNWRPSPLHEIAPSFNALPGTDDSQDDLPECPAEEEIGPVF